MESQLQIAHAQDRMRRQMHRCAHTYKGDIVVLGRPQTNGQDPVGEGALDDGPCQEATLRRTLNVPGRPCRRVPVDDVSEIVGPGNPLPIFINLRLKCHAVLSDLASPGI